MEQYQKCPQTIGARALNIHFQVMIFATASTTKSECTTFGSSNTKRVLVHRENCILSCLCAKRGKELRRQSVVEFSQNNNKTSTLGEQHDHMLVLNSAAVYP